MSRWRNPTAWIVCLFGVVLLAGVVAYNREELELRLDAWRIDALLEDYAATRDEHLAWRMAKLLDEQRLDRVTGDAVLAAITEPIIHLRDGYRADRRRVVTCVVPHSISFRNLRIASSARIGPVSEEQLAGWNLHPNAAAGKSVYSLDLAGEGGTLFDGRDTLGDHRAELICLSRIIDPWSNEILHESIQRHELPFRIAPLVEAERIRLDTEPANKPTVEIVSRGTGLPYFRISGHGSSTSNPPELHVAPNHVAVAFRTEFVDAAGEVHQFPHAAPTIRVAPEDDPDLHGRQIVPVQHLFRKSGRYHGVVRLIPNAEFAYGDARLKAIWGEPIELPIEFEIRMEPR